MGVGGIERFQERVEGGMEEDLKLSMRIKEKKNYYHKYEEKEDGGTVWISQPKWIPNEVSDYYE